MNGELCPYHEHAPVTPSGAAAWDVLMDGAGQTRRDGRGRVVGLDLGVLLALGAARGCDPAALSLLLPACEAGLIVGVARLLDGDGAG